MFISSQNEKKLWLSLISKTENSTRATVCIPRRWTGPSWLCLQTIDDYCYIGDCNHKTFPPAPAPSALLCLGWSSSIQRAWSPSQLLPCQQDPSCSHDAELLQVKPSLALCCAGVFPPAGAQRGLWMLLTAARRRHCRQGRGAAGGWVTLPAAPSDGEAETLLSEEE